MRVVCCFMFLYFLLCVFCDPMWFINLCTGIEEFKYTLLNIGNSIRLGEHWILTIHPLGFEEENQEHLAEQEIIVNTTSCVDYESSYEGGNYSDIEGQLDYSTLVSSSKL